MSIKHQAKSSNIFVPARRPLATVQDVREHLTRWLDNSGFSMDQVTVEGEDSDGIRIMIDYPSCDFLEEIRDDVMDHASPMLSVSWSYYWGAKTLQGHCDHEPVQMIFSSFCKKCNKTL